MRCSSAPSSPSSWKPELITTAHGHAGVGGVLEGREHAPRGHGDDGQVDRCRDVGERGRDLDAVDRQATRVDDAQTAR